MHNYRSNESLVSCNNLCIFVEVSSEFTLEGCKSKIINTSDAYFLSIRKNYSFVSKFGGFHYPSPSLFTETNDDYIFVAAELLFVDQPASKQLIRGQNFTMKIYM